MDEDPDFDWSLTTWDGSRRAQLRRALTLTLRERLDAAEGLADVARRFQEIRRQGGFRDAASASEMTRGEPVAAEMGGQGDVDSGNTMGGAEGVLK